MATFGQLKSRLEAMARRRLSASADDHEDLLSVAVNAALHAIQEAEEWRAMEQTLTLTATAGSRSASLPSRYKSHPRLYVVGKGIGEAMVGLPSRIRVPHEYRGELVTRELLEEVQPDLTATAEYPSLVCFWGESALFDYALSEDLTFALDCYAYLDDLTSPEETNWFTERLEEAVLWEAARWYYLMLHEPLLAEQWHRAAVERMAIAAPADRRERATRVTSVENVPWPPAT